MNTPTNQQLEAIISKEKSFTMRHGSEQSKHEMGLWISMAKELILARKIIEEARHPYEPYETYMSNALVGALDDYDEWLATPTTKESK